MLTKQVRCFLLALGLGLSFPVLAQESKPVSCQLRFSPLALLDTNTPVLQLGGQVRVRRYALSAEYGLALNLLGTLPKDSMFKDPSYYKIRTEARYYLAWNKNNKFSRLYPYISLEGFWVPRQFRRYNDLLHKEDGTYRYTYSDISRNVRGGCIKFGLEPVVYKRWRLDGFWGLDIRQLKITHHPVGLEPDPQPNWVAAFFAAIFQANRIDQREGTFYRPHLAGGFKIGFALN